MKKLPIEIDLYEAWEIRIALYRTYEEIENIIKIKQPKESENFFKEKKEILDELLDKVDNLFGHF